LSVPIVPVDVLQGSVCSGGTGTEEEDAGGCGTGCGNAGGDGRGTRSCASEDSVGGARLDESRIGLANSAPGFAEVKLVTLRRAAATAGAGSPAAPSAAVLSSLFRFNKSLDLLSQFLMSIL